MAYFGCLFLAVGFRTNRHINKKPSLKLQKPAPLALPVITVTTQNPRLFQAAAFLALAPGPMETLSYQWWGTYWCSVRLSLNWAQSRSCPKQEPRRVKHLGNNGDDINTIISTSCVAKPTALNIKTHLTPQVLPAQLPLTTDGNFTLTANV